MTVQSNYNVVVPLKEVDGVQYHALFNTLAGSLEVIDQTVANQLDSYDKGNTIEIFDDQNGTGPLCHENETYLSRRGYLFETKWQEMEQSRLIYNAMLNFHRKDVRLPVVVIPSYNCDLKCPYCWQRLHHMDSPIISEERVNHLMEAIPKLVDINASNPVDLIVFGGEPLQNIPELRSRVIQLLDMGSELGFSTKIISNGVGLKYAVPMLKGKADVIQVTIDGPERLHLRRRPLPHKGDSWTPMVEGVTAALEAGIHINVRVNTDKENLPLLPELAEFMASQGWLDSGRFTPHIAPVKNHNPNKTTNPESELLNSVLDLVGSDERMACYNLDGFSGLKYFQGFKESGMLSLHRFFNCESQIGFWAFDLHGDIFACWDAAGIKEMAVGTYYPELKIDQDKLAPWRERTSLDIESCQGCKSQPHCGGGCQFLAYEHEGKFLASNCDSMMEGYVQAIKKNADWLLQRADAGDHAVGLVTEGGVRHMVTCQFGLEDAPVDVVNCG